MSLEQDLYKEIILENYKATKNKRRLENPTSEAEGNNPSCGDDLTLYMQVNGDTVEDVSYEGMGCSICCASANLLCEALRGAGVEEAKDIIRRFRGMLVDGSDPDFQGRLEDLEAMSGVKDYPVRIKCALLAWSTAAQIVGLGGIDNESR